MPKVLSPEEGEEYLRLFGEYKRAVNDTHEALVRFGMESKQFAEADARGTELWRQLRKLQGMDGKHWMA